jgi:5-methyltetrahydrofolate--homocysteine methyltransferase
MPDYQGLSDSVINGKQQLCVDLTNQAIAEGIAPEIVLNQGLIPGMDVVGDRFRRNVIYVPEVLISARAMKAAMEVLRPLLAETGAQPIGTAVLGTIKGDLHDIGKNLVGMMWEGTGVKVVDIGINNPAEKYIKAVREHNATVIGMSALLTTTMINFKTVHEALIREGLREQVKLVCGGAPVNANFAKDVGCDAYAPDAATAVQVIKYLFGIHSDASLFKSSGGWVKGTE